WRIEGRHCACGAIDAGTASGNSAIGRRETLGEEVSVAASDTCGNLFWRKPRQGRDQSVTVCIAARSFSAVFLVSDRMITSGDIQFEPPVAKIFFLTSSIAIMAAGDSAFHTEIMKDVVKEVNDRVVAEPDNWWLVKDIVDIYIKYRNVAKLKRSEATILAPLNLDRNSWLINQKIMDSNLIESIARDLIAFDLPEVSVIIAEIDNLQNNPTTHIYSIHNDYISCDDSIGFRAIGSGARHAESQFMLTGHAWNSGPHATAALAYRAKKDAEIAPGVGKGTDMYMIAGLGNSSQVRPNIQEKMEREYQKMKKKYVKIQDELNKEVKRYVDSLPPTDIAIQANKPETAEIAEEAEKAKSN
ncbi:hypothetical protein L0244_38775, partial [bacterium]|nr:hypothetical protein [bacterium]